MYRLAQSANLWERRIAIIATPVFIARHEFADTLGVSEMLLADPHDLIHKAAACCCERSESVTRRSLRGS